MHPHLKNHPLGTHSLTNSTFNVSRIIELKLFDILSRKYLINSFQKYLCTCHFLNFYLYTFSWAWRSLHKPQIFFHLLVCTVHSLVCPITYSFFNGFQQHFPHVYSTYYIIFGLKKTLECICERLLHCRFIQRFHYFLQHTDKIRKA